MAWPRRTRRDTVAYRLRDDGSIEEVISTALTAGDRVVVAELHDFLEWPIGARRSRGNPAK